MSQSEVPSPPNGSAPNKNHDQLLAEWVGRGCTELYQAYRADKAWAVARLARLRRVTGPDPGANPDTWDVLQGLPPELVGHGDELGRSEWAAITSLVLFATHQQSRRDQPMHLQGARLGKALRRLPGAQSEDDDAAVMRRVKVLLASGDREAFVRNLRSLVTQLRSERLGFDYGRLARDLVLIQGNRANQVRLNWARDFYTSTPGPSAEQTATKETAE